MLLNNLGQILFLASTLLLMGCYVVYPHRLAIPLKVITAIIFSLFLSNVIISILKDAGFTGVDSSQHTLFFMIIIVISIICTLRYRIYTHYTYLFPIFIYLLLLTPLLDSSAAIIALLPIFPAFILSRVKNLDKGKDRVLVFLSNFWGGYLVI